MPFFEPIMKGWRGKMSLDKINIKILEILKNNGRESYIDIGKRVNLSRVAVKTRIDNMIAEGIIENFTITTNPDRMGRATEIFFDVYPKPRKMYEVSNKLCEISNITDVHHMTGGRLHIHALFSNKDELNKFLENVLYPMDGIESINSEMIIKRAKQKQTIGL